MVPLAPSIREREHQTELGPTLTGGFSARRLVGKPAEGKFKPKTKEKRNSLAGDVRSTL